MKYPALDVRGADAEMVLAIVDDCSPTAVEEFADGISIFFATASTRDRARDAVELALPQATTSTRDVDDEDWARRSQENLTPITVDNITVTPPWFSNEPLTSGHPSSASAVVVTILPSTGFGTGHHATTRLCLHLLQTLELRGARVLDVGTGSGVLAIAASLLGASEVLGIDFDADAIANARENLELNPAARNVDFEVLDVRQAALTPADVVLANLTGAVLVQNAALLSSAVARGGTLIVSGLQTHERDEVLEAFRGCEPRLSQEEAGWVAIAFNFHAGTGV